MRNNIDKVSHPRGIEENISIDRPSDPYNSINGNLPPSEILPVFQLPISIPTDPSHFHPKRSRNDRFLRDTNRLNRSTDPRHTRQAFSFIRSKRDIDYRDTTTALLNEAKSLNCGA